MVELKVWPVGARKLHKNWEVSVYGHGFWFCRFRSRFSSNPKFVSSNGDSAASYMCGCSPRSNSISSCGTRVVLNSLSLLYPNGPGTLCLYGPAAQALTMCYGPGFHFMFAPVEKPFGPWMYFARWAFFRLAPSGVYVLPNGHV